MAAALKRDRTKRTKEPGDDNAYHGPRCNAESSTAENASVEEDDGKLHRTQRANLYEVEAILELPFTVSSCPQWTRTDHEESLPF